MNEAADLRHVDTWLFDLDNTLYPEAAGLWALIGGRITDYVAGVTGLPTGEAFTLQKTWLMDHGITLSGLMKHHGTDPDHYHDYVHDVPLDELQPDPKLAAALARLPGRRLVFTNADDKHARRVLARIGIAELFDDIFHIASADYWPKPSPESFERIVAAHGIAPATTAFFEDSERNLAPAKAIGMTTVLVGAHAPNATGAFVDYRTVELTPFLDAALVMEPA
jgi:putative hydrolase of the HAD superfamily